MAAKTETVVYEGPETHVHVGDRAFDNGIPVEVPRDDVAHLSKQLKKGELRVVKQKGKP